MLAGLTALVIYLLQGFEAGLSRDPAVFLYGGEHAAHGTPPYVAIFNSVGPLSDGLPAMVIWVGDRFGADPVLAVRISFAVISAACGALVFALARTALRSTAAGVVAFGVFLTFGTFTALATGGPREKTAMVAFLVAALLCVLGRRWWWAGCFAALATLTWQPALAPAAVAAVVGILLTERARLRAAVRYLLGGLVPSAVVVAYFAAQGALAEAVSGFIVFNVRDAEQPSMFDDGSRIWQMMWHGYHASLIVALAGLLTLFVRGFLAARRRGSDLESPEAAARRVGLVVCSTAGIAAVGWTILVVNGAPDLFVVLPFAALGAAALVQVVTDHLSRRLRVIVSAVVCVAGVVTGTAYSLGLHDHDLDHLDEQRAEVTALIGALPPGSTVLSVNAPQVLVLSGRDNPTPYQIFSRSMHDHLERTYPGGLAGYEQTVAELAPTAIAVGTQFDDAVVDELIHRDYVPVDVTPYWTWYVRRDVGEDVLARIAEVVNPEN